MKYHQSHLQSPVSLLLLCYLPACCPLWENINTSSIGKIMDWECLRLLAYASKPVTSPGLAWLHGEVNPPGRRTGIRLICCCRCAHHPRDHWWKKKVLRTFINLHTCERAALIEVPTVLYGGKPLNTQRHLLRRDPPPPFPCWYSGCINCTVESSAVWANVPLKQP